MNPPSDEQRQNARAVLTRRFEKAPLFSASSGESSLAVFVNNVEESLFKHKRNHAAYRDQLLAIVSNAARMIPTLEDFDPADIGQMHPSEMLSRNLKQKQEKRIHKRSREAEALDDTKIHCPECGFVRRSRLNVNRMALDSEELGTQYEYNFDNLCTCGKDVIELNVNSSPDSSDDEDVSQNSDLGRDAKKGPRMENLGQPDVK